MTNNKCSIHSKLKTTRGTNEFLKRLVQAHTAGTGNQKHHLQGNALPAGCKAKC